MINNLRGKGVVVTDPGVGSLLTVRGSANQVERAFNVTLTDYRNASGRVFFTNDRTPVLDASVAGLISGVVGLSNQSRPIPRFQRAPPPAAGSSGPASRTATGCTAAITASQRDHSYTPNQFATAYDIAPLTTAGYRGEGQTIALVEYDDYVDSNIVTYQTCFGSSVNVERVPVNGGFTKASTGQVEVELDIEVIVGLAPHLSHLLVYEDSTTGESSNDLATVFQVIANENRASVISTSWGVCEADVTDSQRATENTVFMQLAAQGQSVLNAYGDNGSEGCFATDGTTQIAADELGSNPYVTGVGGTKLTLNPDNTIQNEVVWNGFGAGGGGISAYFAKPAYQTGPGTTNAYSNGKREGPDITTDGDPTTSYTVYTGSNGGTGDVGRGGRNECRSTTVCSRIRTNESEARGTDESGAPNRLCQSDALCGMAQSTIVCARYHFG